MKKTNRFADNPYFWNKQSKFLLLNNAFEMIDLRKGSDCVRLISGSEAASMALPVNAGKHNEIK